MVKNTMWIEYDYKFTIALAFRLKYEYVFSLGGIEELCVLFSKAFNVNSNLEEHVSNNHVTKELVFNFVIGATDPMDKVFLILAKLRCLHCNNAPLFRDMRLKVITSNNIVVYSYKNLRFMIDNYSENQYVTKSVIFEVDLFSMKNTIKNIIKLGEIDLNEIAAMIKEKEFIDVYSDYRLMVDKCNQNKNYDWYF